MEQIEHVTTTTPVDDSCEGEEFDHHRVSPTVARRTSVPGGVARPRRIIVPTSGWRAINFREMWRFRELLYFLTWRDVQVRYKQTVLGAAWAIIQPLMTMVVFSIFFGRLGGMDRDIEIAYPVFVYAALLPWTYFSASVTQCGQSLIQSERLISKVYFPRLLVPFSAVGAQMVDFCISFLVMLGIMAWYRVMPTANFLLLPFLVFGVTVAALGAGTLLASLSIAYRDFRYVIGFLIQIWMFASPVPYPLSKVPEQWRLAYAVNPMAGLIGGFRAALLGEAVPWDCLVVSFLSAFVLFLFGLAYFRRVERRFADIV